VRDIDKPRVGPRVHLSTRVEKGADVDLIVEVLGGLEPARSLVSAALRTGTPVVTANKTLVAAAGEELRAIAAERHTTFAYDAAVLAGVPFLGSLARRPLVAAAARFEGIVNGTSHVIVGAMERGIAFEAALADAVARGYAEPDSAADTSGRDAAEKLTILLHLAGCSALSQSDLPRFDLEDLRASDFAAARRLGGTIKPVAVASLDQKQPGAWVGPAFVTHAHPLAGFRGVDNALRVVGANGDVVTFSGPGAGPEATALTIVDDIIEAVSAGRGWRAPAARFASSIAASDLRQPLPGRWFLSIACQASQTLPDLADPLAAANAGPPWIALGDRWIGALTTRTAWPAIARGLDACRARGVRAIALPVLDV
jgi:homoserine dehydrogenase